MQDNALPAGDSASLTVSVAEAARLIGCGTNTVYRLIQEKRLPTVNLYNTSRIKRIPRSAVIEFVEQATSMGGAA